MLSPFESQGSLNLSPMFAQELCMFFLEGKCSRGKGKIQREESHVNLMF